MSSCPRQPKLSLTENGAAPSRRRGNRRSCCPSPARSSDGAERRRDIPRYVKHDVSFRRRRTEDGVAHQGVFVKLMRMSPSSFRRKRARCLRLPVARLIPGSTRVASWKKGSGILPPKDPGAELHNLAHPGGVGDIIARLPRATRGARPTKKRPAMSHRSFSRGVPTPERPLLRLISNEVV